MVQLAAPTGVGGITFLVALGSGLAAAAWTSGLKAVRSDLWVFALLVGAAALYGQVRLARPAPGTVVRVGSVVSPVTHREYRGALVNVDTLRSLDRELFARSERAADLGARAVVWNEIATLVSGEGEAALAARGRAFAERRGVLLLMAYGVVRSVHPFHYTYKYRIYLPDGTILADEYVKRHPVPGDPNDQGRVHARVVTFEGVRYGGAICYDYGFPGIARDNAGDGAGLALVPSSDWRGIDPEHGRMALMNAVAVGLPMVRPVRAATSIASDQYGRLLGSMRADGIGRRGDGGGGAERAGADTVRPDGRDRATRGARVLRSRSRPDHARAAGGGGAGPCGRRGEPGVAGPRPGGAWWRLSRTGRREPACKSGVGIRFSDPRLGSSDGRAAA